MSELGNLVFLVYNPAVTAVVIFAGEQQYGQQILA